MVRVGNWRWGDCSRLLNFWVRSPNLELNLTANKVFRRTAKRNHI